MVTKERTLYNKKYYSDNKENKKKYYKQYYLDNRESLDLQNRQYQIDNPEKALIISIRSRSKKHNIPFDLSEDDIVFPKVCPILNIPLEIQVGKRYKTRDNSPSVDRIVPSLGYVKGNIQIISFLANSMKRNATKEQLLLFASWVNKTYA